MEVAEGAIKSPDRSEIPVGIPIYETERNSDVFAFAIPRSLLPRKSFCAKSRVDVMSISARPEFHIDLRHDFIQILSNKLTDDQVNALITDLKN